MYLYLQSLDDSKSGEENLSTADTGNTKPHSPLRPEQDKEQDGEEISEPPSPPGKVGWLLLALKFLLWLIVWLIFIELQFGAVFFTLSALVFVYINTRTGRGSKKESLSAYSVFNQNCERLQGTITAEQFEAELLHRKPLAQS